MFSKMTFVSRLRSWRVLQRDLHCTRIDSGKSSFALASNSTIMIARQVVMCFSIPRLYALPP